MSTTEQKPLLAFFYHWGIRAKLIFLFVLIKVIPLVLLALVAWEGVTHLGKNMNEQSDTLTAEVAKTVEEMGKTFSKEAEKALNDRAREELERLTTDTARAVADFLYDRDQDILFVAKMEQDLEHYQRFIQQQLRGVVDSGEWKLTADGKGWEPVVPLQNWTERQVHATNEENKHDFHYRPRETVLREKLVPLYHEITFVDLTGQERIKVSATDVLPKELRDVSKKENTYAKAENYFAELQKLKPGEIYVSDVIGPYVPSRVIGTFTPEKAATAGIPFDPQQEAYAGKENPLGKRFQGIIRWATPVEKNGKVVGYVTLALDHRHILGFTDHLLPNDQRYGQIADPASGNYAFIWDYQDRSVAHPRHHSIVGFDPNTGEYATPWLEASLYEGWQKSGLPLREYLKNVPIFDQQTRNKKPAKALNKAGTVGLECRYLNFAPQCQGWHDLTQFGGSGSFLILWTGVWKLTTAATIPYYTGHYGNTLRGFGYVTIGANIDEFQEPAKQTAAQMSERVSEFASKMKQRQQEISDLIDHSLQRTAFNLSVSTMLMVIVVVAIAIWLASMLTRRITDLISGLYRIESGEFGFRFPKGSDDELGRLNDSMNRMAHSVEESFERVEEARAQAEEANRMKSDFLARMSHELRTPLNGILGFAELLRMDAANDETYEYADTVYQSGKHLLSLVNDVLDLAKIESGNMVLDHCRFPLLPALRDVIGLNQALAAEKALPIALHIDSNLPEQWEGDPIRVQQVFNHLLNNAVKFTRHGEVQVHINCDEHELHIRVEDTGPGIPEAEHEKIFEKFRQNANFTTRDQGGSGLGLALARELAWLMGGNVVLVRSVVGEGSCFELRLPIEAKCVVPAKA